MRIDSPTGFWQVRKDSQGDGAYGVNRSSRGSLGDILKRRHRGVDLICVPGAPIYAPIDDFTIIRRAYPYEDTRELEGLFFETSWCEGRIWYVQALDEAFGKTFKLGDVIGTAQDVRIKYGDSMRPHIHFQIDSIDPMVL